MEKYVGILSVISLLLVSCALPTSEKAGIKYPTKSAFNLDQNVHWREVSTAKELINLGAKSVVASGGTDPIPLDKWEKFSVKFPWKKNIDRHILIDETVLLRSPNSSSNCEGKECIKQIEYKGYSWIELAQPLAVDFIPSKTDMLKPEEGHLVVKIIKKCQAVRFENPIYQLTDNLGNYYVMHATETGEPNLDVILPEGWTLKKKQIDQPLIVTPFGEREDCYFNIVGDHLGQGYHQYKYADEFYPK